MAFGKNLQREKFGEKVKGIREGMDKGKEEKPAMPQEGEAKTEIMHNGDGSHSVKHSDGEQTQHGHLHEAFAAIHGKHLSGDHGHMAHHHGDGVTTHHVGPDGEPGPGEEHPDVDSAAESMKAKMDDGMGDAGGYEGNMMGVGEY